MAIATETRTAGVARTGSWIVRALLLVGVTLLATPDPARRCHHYTPRHHIEARLAVPIPLARPGLADLHTPPSTGRADLAAEVLAEAFGDARPYPRGIVIAPPHVDPGMVVGGRKVVIGIALVDSVLSVILASLASPHA